MTARAEATAETGRRILAAAYDMFMTLDYQQLTLRALAERAGVTEQTVLRRYGSKEGLVHAVGDAMTPRILASREVRRPGDLDEAVRRLVASFEEMGTLNWRMLHGAEQSPALRERLVMARRLHRGWIEATFAPVLPARGKARERRVLQLFAATDFYVWRLLRVDLGLPVREVERVIRATVASIVGDGVADNNRGVEEVRR